MINKWFVNKIGILIGITIATILVGYYLFSSKTGINSELLSAIDLSVNLGIILGGAISGFIIEKYIINRLTTRGSIAGCIAGSILISPLSVYYGIIFGGLSGMAFVGFLMGFTDIRNIRQIIAFAGIFVGNISVVVIVETIGAMIGTALGSLSTLMSGKK